MTTDAYIFDAIRTPRGRGKESGSLHQHPPLDLLKTLFDAMQQRHDLDTSQVDDVLLGCVTPINEQGGNIARTAPLYAGLGPRPAGSAAKPLLRQRAGSGQSGGHEGSFRLGRSGRRRGHRVDVARADGQRRRGDVGR